MVCLSQSQGIFLVTNITHWTLDICWLAQSIHTSKYVLQSFQILSKLKPNCINYRHKQEMHPLDKHSFTLICMLDVIQSTHAESAHETHFTRGSAGPTVWWRGSAAPPWCRSSGRWSTARARRRAAAPAAAPWRLTAEASLRSRHPGTETQVRWMQQVRHPKKSFNSVQSRCVSHVCKRKWALK